MNFKYECRMSPRMQNHTRNLLFELQNVDSGLGEDFNPARTLDQVTKPNKLSAQLKQSVEDTAEEHSMQLSPVRELSVEYLGESGTHNGETELPGERAKSAPFTSDLFHTTPPTTPISSTKGSNISPCSGLDERATFKDAINQEQVTLLQDPRASSLEWFKRVEDTNLPPTIAS
jgi:hypothetical protein